MTQLALVRPDGYVLMNELCEDTDLPRPFVAKIFQDLVRQGLLISAKGRGGGFALSRSPESITLMDIVAAVDGEEHFSHCVVGLTRCDDRQPCPQHEQFKAIREQICRFLEQTTLQRMAATLKRKMDLTGRRIRQPKTPSKPIE